MAKKKSRRRRPAGNRPAATTQTPSEAALARRNKKETARRERERAVKAQARRSAGRRAVIGGFVGLLVFFAISWFNRVPAPEAFPTTASNAASAAGCSAIQTPVSDPSRDHLAPGEAHTYDQHPATAGVHDPTPLPGTPRIYTDTVSETQAVHSLEHGSVIMYYRASSDPGGLPKGVIAKLGPVATDNPATYLIPYPDLPEGTALAYTAWDKLLTCPAGITADQAFTIGQAFVDTYACTSNAPEGRNGDGC
jgi:hypothetical protein